MATAELLMIKNRMQKIRIPDAFGKFTKLEVIK
jgi:hypothetical protein